MTATAYSCKTNLPPNTAFRGFGGPQGMFAIEAAIAQAAQHLNTHASVIQEKNLIRHGQEFPYGQRAEQEATQTWTAAEQHFDFKKIQQTADDFNKTNEWVKKGVAVMPVCFGISFTKKLMNQARALIHVYTDGSVAVSTGAVEMGQGVNTKILQAVAQSFGIPASRIKLHSTNTLRIANTSPSAASATADLNGRAALMACDQIKRRLFQTAIEKLQVDGSPDDCIFNNEQLYFKHEPTSLRWIDVINEAFANRVNLSEHAHYITPNIHFDWDTAKGHPFAYHVYGTVITQVTLDCLRGRYEIDFVKGVHDFGKPMNSDIDMGQIEGGLVQGIGWMTMEEVVYNAQGKLTSNALSTYKVPDVYSVPHEITILPLPVVNENLALLSSKAVGEPPLMYGLGVYFAIRNAIRAFQPEADPPFDAPFTPEKVLLQLYPEMVARLEDYTP